MSCDHFTESLAQWRAMTEGARDVYRGSATWRETVETDADGIPLHAPDGDVFARVLTGPGGFTTPELDAGVCDCHPDGAA